MTDLRDLIAETLAAHVDTIHAKTMTCACGWTKPVIPETLILVGHAHRLHRADAAVAVVAEWLHRKAADTRAVADVLPATDEREAIGAAKMLDALADALTQKEPTP